MCCQVHKGPYFFFDLDVQNRNAAYDPPFDPSLFVCSDGVLELKNTSHLAFVHFEGLLNVHKSPIFNEILTKIPDTRFLFEIPSSI